MENYTITFIGGGNMAFAIIGGLMRAGVDPQRIHVVDPDPNASRRLQETWPIQVKETLDDEAAMVDIMLLAIKPQVMPDVLKDIKHHLAESDRNPVILSIASGISLDTMRNILGDRPIIRAMPNTPALVGAGITALVGNQSITEQHQRWASDLMSQVGECLWLGQESQMDTVTAVSGSGPAYFFLLAEQLVAAGIAEGLDPLVAERLVYQTALGAGEMLKQSSDNAAALRERVTSPGGTTEAALAVFQEHHFEHLVAEAIRAAKKRGQILGKAPSSPSQPKEH